VSQEEAWAFEREAAWNEFVLIVSWVRAGDKTRAAEYLRKIEAKFGRKVSDEAKQEVINAARLWKKLPGE